MTEILRPQVGVGLLIVKGDEAILGKRLSSHGIGEYGGPGGHLEGSESFEECILREVSEEMGDDIQLGVPEFLCVTNMRKYNPKHYIDIGMVAIWKSGNPRVTEPEKLESWDWYNMDDLPQPLFGCFRNYVEAYRTGQAYFQE